MPISRQKSVTAGRRQRGAALLIFMILFTMAALAYLVGNLTSEEMVDRRARQTDEALAQAREALIGYALRYREQELAKDINTEAMYGYLPLPDLGTNRNNNTGCTQEGCDANTFTGNVFDVNGVGPSVVGRLPWRTLGIEPLRDGSGECLWLIVSSLHSRILRTTPAPTPPAMNWDTLGQFDIVVANGTSALASALNSAHDRPVAVIFSPGPPLPGQDRGLSGTDDVTVCGGNYEAKNYLDLVDATVFNYLAGTNSASGATGDSDLSNDPNDAPPAKRLLIQDKVFASGGNFLPHACAGNCTALANDKGLVLTGDQLFGAIRKHASFRTDINSMLDRMSDCLRDLGTPAGFNKILNDACYGAAVVPVGYFPNYQDQVYVASGAMAVNGSLPADCRAALLFASQRAPGQLRESTVQRGDPGNYLEGINLASYPAGTEFSGPETFERVSQTQTLAQDIARCIPSTPSFVTTPPVGGAPQLASYDPGTRTLTLGQAVTTAPLPGSMANFLFGCAWRPESHPLDSGLRSYFTFRINDAGTLPGFTFTLVDGENNGTDACGAAGQHLGYSGNNTATPFIAPPKLAVEIDLRRDAGLNWAATNHLSNGRNDPSTSPANYGGGHIALTYWGGEMPIDTTRPIPVAPAVCTPPSYPAGATCRLPQEEDDNVHGRPGTARPGFPAPPANPAPPPTRLNVPPDEPAGFYKLDPTVSGTPVNQLFHARIELTRTSPIRITTNVPLDLNAPGAIINGATMIAGDRVWVRHQADPNDNGLYRWQGAALPLQRLADGDDLSQYNLPAARVATTAPIADLNNPGQRIDDVYLFPGDRVLLKDQGNRKQNGVYVWQGAAAPLVRAADASTSAQLAGLIVEVRQGRKNAGTLWRQNATSVTVNTTPLSWTRFHVKLVAPAGTPIVAPGAELDGIRMKVEDRVLVRGQGVYLWKGAAVPMVSASDVIPGSIVQIQQGTEANSLWRVDGALSTRLDFVRTAAPSNQKLAAPDAIIGGVLMVAGDLVLLKNQTNAAENGLYVWGGGGLVRTASANSAALLAGALVQVREGFDAGRLFRQTTLPYNGTIGTDAVRWESTNRATSYLLEAWIQKDSPTMAQIISAMQDTTRPMNLLTRSASYPNGYPPQLRDRPQIPHALRRMRPGFTMSQNTGLNDQTITIRNFFTTWLP